MTILAPRLILGSASPRRLQLLAQIGIVPDIVTAADIDETPLKNEDPKAYCLRVAVEKNAALVAQFPDDYIVTADTTVVVGKRILGKADDVAAAEKMLRLLSGRAHEVMTAIVVRGPRHDKPASRLCIHRVTVKRLSEPELRAYLDGNEWHDAAGAYKLQGSFAMHVSDMRGTPSGIIGLPLFETAQLLKGLGYGIAA